jgi:hypothetical protein
MIYTAPYVMFFISADPFPGQVGGGWALEIDTFLGPVKWHRAVMLVKKRREGDITGWMGGGGGGAVRKNYRAATQPPKNF